MASRQLWGLLLLLIGAFGLGAEGTFKWNLFAHTSKSWLEVNKQSRWNPGNQFDIAQSELGLQLQTDLRYSWSGGKILAVPVLAGDQQGEWQGTLRELSLNLSLGGTFDLTVGKVLSKLGTGYLFTPISVITPAKAISDPDDSSRSQRGVEMVKLDFFAENFNLSALVFKKNNWQNLALFAYATLWHIDLYGILYYPEYRQLEFGLAAATTIGAAIEVHGEVMVHRRSPHLTHRVFGDDDPKVSFSDYPLTQAATEGYVELLLGSNITLGKLSLIAEYYHSDWGLSRKDWQRLGQHFDFNMTQTPSPLTAMNIAADLTLLAQRRRGAMQDYGFVRLATQLGETALSALALCNLADGSFLAQAEIDHHLGHGVFVYFRPILFSGSKGSEFGEAFYASMLQLGCRVVL